MTSSSCGHVVLGQGERGLGLAERAAREALVLGRQLAAHRAPDLVLGVRVGDARHRRARAPGERGRGDLVAAPPVLRVAGAGMVVGQVDLDAVGTLGDRCVELRLFEHPSGLRARGAARQPQECVSFRVMTTIERLDRPGSEDPCAAAARRSTIVRGHRPRDRPLDARGQAPRRPARGERRDPRLRRGRRRVQARASASRRSPRSTAPSARRRATCWPAWRGSTRWSAPSRCRASPTRCCACRSTTSAISSA